MMVSSVLIKPALKLNALTFQLIPISVNIIWMVKTMGATNKVIIHGVNVRECQYYSGGIPYFTNTEWTCRCETINTRCENYPNCYYKRFIRVNAERNRYKQALHEVEVWAKQMCDACKEFTPNTQSDVNCRYCNSTQILNIINKTEGEPNE